MERSDRHDRDPRSEHAVEVRIASSPALRDDFAARVAPVDRFHRQLPVGLFDGSVSTHTRWTPGNGSKVDLWATSPDRRTFHVFELKTHGNVRVGILPEALSYARLLHHVRTGRVAGEGPALDAVRAAERIVAWLVTPRIHPLVADAQGTGPLAWLNQAMAGDGVELRVLPIAIGEDGTVAWSGPAVG